MGIPRLKFPRGAPSRSTLKLEEALLHFLDERERADLLQPGMTAVDLGAAPGGWTWQLVKRHLRVTAVDNGALEPSLLASGVVEHVRTDGFRYRPPKPVQWMVCDIVEQPIRIADLAARWLAQGWCERTLFNLKLPMKKRYQEVRRCLARIDEVLQAAGVTYTLSCKQLYHDREEVTVYVQSRR
jgi:23S rRNA (cytidine2498-2'-O)-methyltransferase